MRRGDWGSWRQSVNPKLKRKANEGTENGTGVYRDGTIDWLKYAATVDSSQTTGDFRSNDSRQEQTALRPLPSIPYELSSVSKILKVQKAMSYASKTADTPFPSVTWADRSRSSKAASRKQSAFLISGPGNG